MVVPGDKKYSSPVAFEGELPTVFHCFSLWRIFTLLEVLFSPFPGEHAYFPLKLEINILLLQNIVIQHK